MYANLRYHLERIKKTKKTFDCKYANLEGMINVRESRKFNSLATIFQEVVIAISLLTYCFYNIVY